MQLGRLPPNPPAEPSAAAPDGRVPPSEPPGSWNLLAFGRGILVYWHVERGSVAVHSQTLQASASEVSAMVEGAIRHGTTMNVEGNYTDTHGQSFMWTSQGDHHPRRNFLRLSALP